jgi:lipopolysaccharide export system permease protein
MTLVTLGMTGWAVPWGRVAFTLKGTQMARANITVAFKERQFSTPFDNVMIYVNAIDVKTGAFRNIFIEDGRSPDSVNITVAAEGSMVSPLTDCIP